MPPEGATVKFENIQNLLATPLILYADFESILSPISDPAGPQTVRMEEHQPCSVGLKVISINREFHLP